MIVRRAFGVALFVFAAGIAGGLLRAQPAAPLTPDLYKQLKFRYIGPVGNRVIAIAGVPANPNVYYAGAASGGIFKTTDAGAHWDAVFDDQPVSSIGSLAVAPSDPNVIWAGTGEAFIRSNISIGNGIYKSTDAGRTWTHVGLDKTGRIGRVLVDPRNPDVVIACALGNAYGPQQERGVFRTDRRRQDVGSAAVRRREHRLLGRRDGRDEPAHPLRRDVADRNSHVGPHERRSGQRPVQVDRRRRRPGSG